MDEEPVPLGQFARLRRLSRCHVRGPIREVYGTDPATTPPDQLITHLMIPSEEP
ncbi:hypothetical protein AB0L05_10700 [Nonomuraea pusilla]|uniref:hypothetical protein n=1 Tax=Nonomuraea pusilla TaxID=46177 RepID=UPI00331AC7BE